MKRLGPSFPRGNPDQPPTEGALDELLPEDADVPEAKGGLAAYQEGSRVRRRVYGALIIGAIGAVVAGQLYIRWLDHRRHNPIPEYELAPGTEHEARAREIEWTSGFARLGLSRTEPAVEAIVLPDRVLRLAEGCDHAQVKVNVVDGVTVQLKVITGEIVSEPR